MNVDSKHSVFISHSSFDKQFVRRLGSDLEAHGIKARVDEAEVRPGDDFISKMNHGLKNTTHVLIVFSPYSIISSWVREETHAAQIRAVRGETRLIPVLLGEFDADDIPLLLQSRVYVDFRRPDQYQNQFRRLLSAFDVVSFDERTEKATVLLPRIEDANVLSGRAASGLAIEILVINPSAKHYHINRATVGSYRPDMWAYFFPPPTYTYQLDLKIAASLSQADILISGTAKEPSDDWGRPASGHVSVSGGRMQFEVTFPIYLEFEPKDRALIRFVFSELNLDENEDPSRGRDSRPVSRVTMPEDVPSFKSRSGRGGHSWVILEGDFGEPVAARINTDELLSIFRSADFRRRRILREGERGTK